ncbi:MAG: NAD-dependent epimerase/dehydratase family protein [Thermoleophilaceae bacterium]
MNVLVTGAQGFIGSRLAERLLDEGRGVVALRRDVEPGSRFRGEGIEERCTLALADLSDYDGLVRVLNEHEVAEVFHLGAQTIVGTASRSPLGTWEANVRGTWCLLDACRTLGSVRRVIVASSDKAYGSHEELPYREDFALVPRHPYDVSKACADLIARCYAYDYGMRVAVTRFANVYGPGDLNWSRIVPDTARALARGQRPVIRSDGTPERDYLYVEDAVDAYLAIAASLDRPALSGRAWNAGWGRPVSVLDLVRTLISVAGRSVEPDIRGKGTPPGEIGRQYLDATALREELGWEPRWDLERGLRASWEWYERRLSG